MENVSRHPIIGVLGVPEDNYEKSSVISLSTGYKNAIIEKGGIPFMIPPIQSIDYWNTKLKDIPPLTEEEKEKYREMVSLCNGIIIPGGYRFYEWHEYIVRYAIDKNMPILGTCLGLQLLSKIGNGSLQLEEINTDINHKAAGQKYVHKVEIEKDSILGHLCDESIINVNSAHKFHVTRADGFNITARSEDGVIEAIEMPNKNFVVGVQWHPERMFSYDENANKLLERFFEECKKYNIKDNNIDAPKKG